MNEADQSAEKSALSRRFHVLCDIVRAQHFAWREAFLRLAPGVPPQEAVDAMWEITARQTARAYLKRLRVADPSGTRRPLAERFAECVADSSRCMGEDAVVEKEGDDAALVRHRDCPWHGWHRRLGLLAEDRPGCDRWFSATADEVNRELGTSLRVETLMALPDGDPCCLRRIRDAHGDR